MLPGRPRPRRGARSLGAVQGPWRTGWDVRIDVGTVHEEPGASAGAEGEAVDLQAPGVPSLLRRRVRTLESMGGVQAHSQ